MSYTPQDFIADQLKAAAPKAEWDAAGVDRAHELAAILFRNGIIDLPKLHLVQAKTQWRRYAWEPLSDVTGLALEYEGRYLGFLGTPDRADSTQTLELSGSNYLIAWSAAGHGNVSYALIPVAGGFAIAPLWASSSDWGTARTMIKVAAVMVLSFVLPAAGVGVGELVGQSIVSAEFAAAYPAATSAIGNLAVSTAMNGGDVESAVKGLALSYAGGEAGAFVGSGVAAATDAASIGRLASAATAALIQGGDVKTAVGYALLREGTKVDFNSDIVPGGMADLGYNAIDPGWNFDNGAIAVTPEIAAQTVADWQNQQNQYAFEPWLTGGGYDVPSPTQPYDVGPVAPIVADPNGFTLPRLFHVPDLGSPIGPGVVTTPPPSQPSSWSANDVINTISNAALATLKVSTLWDQRRNPIGNVARQTLPNGAVRSVNSNGTVSTRNPNGTVSTSLPPVNQPQSTVDGNIINNNGDGTYTVVTPNGASQLRQYPAGSTSASLLDNLSLGNINPMMLAGIGLAAAFLFMKRR